MNTGRGGRRPCRVTIAARKSRLNAVHAYRHAQDGLRRAPGSVDMMATTGDGSHQELTSKLAALDLQLLDLSDQWAAVERAITEHTPPRRELIAQQMGPNVDHAY